MKLYTEEQVRATWNAAFMEGMSIDSEIYEPIFFEDYLNSLPPIELPSDEEIKKQFDVDEFDPYDLAYLGGAIRMRNLIQGGNDDQQ